MKQTTSLELSKRLHKLVEGVERNWIFAWMKLEDGWNVEFHTSNTKFSSLSRKKWEDVCKESIPTYTLAELWDLMPDGKEYEVRLTKDTHGYRAELIKFNLSREKLISNPSPTEALGLMYEYILENKIK